MDSSSVLLQAASRLEPLMSNKGGNNVLKQSLVAQVSAHAYYQAQVMSRITSSKAFQKSFRDTIFGQIKTDFSEYMDAQARIKPKQFHHVYEWKKAGNPSARLFKLVIKGYSGISFNIGFEFKPSKSFVPAKGAKRRHVFVNKAQVMEEGNPLVISPKNAERLVFEINDYTVFMPKGQSVNVKNPGGVAVKNSFTMAYSRFFKTDLVNLSIKKSGFQRLFNSNIVRAMKLPNQIKKVSYKFSPNALISQASNAVDSAFGGIV